MERRTKTNIKIGAVWSRPGYSADKRSPKTGSSSSRPQQSPLHRCQGSRLFASYPETRLPQTTHTLLLLEWSNGLARRQEKWEERFVQLSESRIGQRDAAQ